MPMKPRIAVLGSINMDLVIRCSELPRPGETLLAESAMEVCGGKGANQAVAAIRAGGSVQMVGRVGDDLFADRLVNNLSSEGIDCYAVQRTEGCSSGLAIVAVDSHGQNSILVVPGANGRVSRQDVESARAIIENSDVLLVQLEVPIDAVIAAIEIANRSGVRVILDPAPASKDLPDSIRVELICPNESEAETLLDANVCRRFDGALDIEQAATALRERYDCNVAITMGERGTLLVERSGSVHRIPSVTVSAVDTTAAGDAFAGALAVFWAEGRSLIEAIELANRAGAIAASRVGAQPSIGHRSEIESLA